MVNKSVVAQDEWVVAEVTFDRAMIAEFIDPDPSVPCEFAISLLESFVEDVSTQVAVLQAAAERGDATCVKAAAHRLQGATATLGANRMSRLCGEIEKQLLCAAEFQVLSGLIDEVSDELPRVSRACAEERRSLEGRSQS
jgi:HPt (histidine-containing phosphotransfer) domain-containing protein